MRGGVVGETASSLLRGERSRRGFACIALEQPKFSENVGGVLRAAGVYEASLVVLCADRLKRGGVDTMRAYRHVPVLTVEDIFSVVPVDCVAVAVDMLPGACPLPRYRHPERAFYIFGGEDRTLSCETVARCRDCVYVPTRISMNLAAAVNVLLYDRAAKRDEWPTRLCGGGVGVAYD